MKNEISVIELKLKGIQEELQNLRPLAEKVRAFYKHQGRDNDSSSEAFILSFENLFEVRHCLDSLNELEPPEEGKSDD